MKIAVLLASYNRKEKTLRCIESISRQQLGQGVSLEIHLTDDNSDDGTAAAVEVAFPEVQVYNGTGQLFWAGGMRRSWANALHPDVDYYLLLNDDVTLFEDAIQRLLTCSKQVMKEKGTAAICVGPTRDGITSKISYGGRNLYSKYRPQSYLIHSDTHYLECDLGDGNIMLVPKAVVDRVGILSDQWTHGIADHDYTYRAKEAGFRLVAAPGFYGICTYDKGKGWKSGKVKLSERLQYLYSPTGLQYKEYLAYIRKYYPYDLPLSFLKLWTKTLFPFVYDTFKKQ